MRAVLLGATGYTGQVLFTLLSDHPDVDEIVPVSRSHAGKEVVEAIPKLAPHVTAKLRGSDGRLVALGEAAGTGGDVVFSCLPHLTSAEVLEPFYDNAVIVDLSADFRIPDVDAFTAAYGAAPPRADLLSESVYGLTELFRKRVREADIVANPGCYPTAILLPLLPLIQRGMVGPPIVANALSGVTGAGKKVAEPYLFTEVDESIRAYAPGRSHRHWYEMAHYLRSSADFLFIPHLVPMRRGIAATIACTRKNCAGDADLVTAYRDAFGNSPFLRVTPDAIPSTGRVVGSNRCDISWRIEGDSVLLFSCIDNLLKGAAGQAVQNMNVRFGFDEAAGLPRHAMI
ncbi:MAG: N-acetyl-gamma-glutamyl-phosphate reductase [Spirochaetaceae bacterium]